MVIEKYSSPIGDGNSVYIHLLSGMENFSGQRDKSEVEKEMSTEGSKRAAQKSQCLYHEKRRKPSDRAE